MEKNKLYVVNSKIESVIPLESDFTSGLIEDLRKKCDEDVIILEVKSPNMISYLPFYVNDLYLLRKLVLGGDGHGKLEGKEVGMIRFGSSPIAIGNSLGAYLTFDEKKKKNPQPTTE